MDARWRRAGSSIAERSLVVGTDRWCALCARLPRLRLHARGAALPQDISLSLASSQLAACYGEVWECELVLTKCVTNSPGGAILLCQEGVGILSQVAEALGRRLRWEGVRGVPPQ
jgi:hypothetical protein